MEQTLSSEKRILKSVNGKVGWRSPSNIALVKYWGKRPIQIPENPSISLTLSSSHTDTYCAYQLKDTPSSEISLKFRFEGAENIGFGNKIEKWLASMFSDFDWLSKYDFEFDSANSFPHSAGIASSASAMSAIAMCLCEIESQMQGANEIDLQKASHIARLGSGSACRSLFPHAAIWGEMEGSSDQYATSKSKDIDPIFHTFKDTILIVDKSPKSVSSTVGHSLMKNNLFAPPRYEQARNNMNAILEAMKIGDLERTGAIVEQEALTLHAMMMLSDFILLKPGSLAIIEAVRSIRAEKGWPLYFTIDAGPNIHLLYPAEIAEEVGEFIESTLKQYCQTGQIIYDEVGKGPVNLMQT